MRLSFYSMLSVGTLLLAAMFVACGDDGSSATSEQASVVSIEKKSISGISQKGPFVEGSSVKLYELRSKDYALTGKNFTGKINSNDGKFSLPSVTLSSQYALLEANGYFRNEVTGEKSKGTITLNALTDLSDREKVNVNLLTHLEYERALYLIGTGLSVKAAKKQAEAEIFRAFEIQGDFANSEDLDIFSKGEGNAALLAISVLMLYDRDGEEASLTEFLAKFAMDIEKDGTWDDEDTKVEIADWASSTSLSHIRRNIEEWNLGDVPEFEKYVRNFWNVIFGLGTCDKKHEGEIKVSNNKKIYLTIYDRFICKDGVWFFASDYEKDTYKWDAGKDGEVRAGDVTGKKYTYFKSLSKWLWLDGWSLDVPKELRLNPEINYGTMTDSRDGKVYKTVKIGDFTWMAENLNYADSVSSPGLKGNIQCINNDVSNCEVTGRYYTWTAAMDSICPPGWHLPSEAEWESLFATTYSLASRTGWESVNRGNTADSVGFSAMPCGFLVVGQFDMIASGGYAACFWNSSSKDLVAIGNEEAYCNSYGDWGGATAATVRCVEDHQ